MESMHPRTEPQPLDPELFRELNDVMHRAVAEDSEQLYWDSLSGSADEAEGVEMGVYWAFPEDELDDGELVRFAVYNESGRYAMQNLLKEERDTLAAPVGHVELEKMTDVARFTAVIYAFEDGTATARLDCRLIGDEVLSEDSESCFDFADSIGMGNEWTRFMFRSQEGDCREEFFIELDDGRANQLANFLNSLEDKV